MSADQIDRILADFRTWLEALPDLAAPRPEAPPAVDLGTLAAHFTALRHDVNLQTKAARAALDQSNEVVKQLATRPTPPDAEAHLKPTRKLLVDLADALSLSLKQVTRAVDSLADLEEAEEPAEWPAMPEAPALSLWGRLRGGSPSAAWHAWVETMRARAEALGEDHAAAQERFRPVLAGLADGYALGLRRVERALPQYALEPIECVGEPFDPELMEVVEVVGDSDAPSGTVVSVVRAGYRVGDTVFRFAQVAVAR